MLAKFLIGLLIVWLSWRLWRGWGSYTPRYPAADRRGARDGLGEARTLLGVAPGADAETVRSAHRRLVAEVHPDRGGSEAEAAAANAARDALLADLSRGR